MKEITRLSAEEIHEFCEKNMPPGFVESKKKTDKRKICIALLTYDARSFNRTWMCILSAIFQCAAQGWEVSIALRESDSMVARGRSYLASQFLNNPDAGTDLVYIDNDLEWHADEFIRLCSHPVDVIGGAYPYKDDGGNFPLRWPPDGLMEENGLWEVQAVTPGFMRITRRALEKVARERPWIKFADPGMVGKSCWMFFNNEARQTGVYDEGYIFCEHWRGVGGKVYLDPDFNLTHIGLKAYNHGTLRGWLAKKAETFEKLESEYPEVPPLKLMDAAMGRPVDLEAEKAKANASHDQHSGTGQAGTAGDDGHAHAAEHQAAGHDHDGIGGRRRRAGTRKPESAAEGVADLGQAARGHEGREIRPRLNGGAG